MDENTLSQTMNEEILNVFCPTGKGGGIDPGCRKGGIPGPKAWWKGSKTKKGKKAPTERMKKTGEGEYEYKGRKIYKTTIRSGAYAPWRVNLRREGFNTLSEVKAFLDSKG